MKINLVTFLSVVLTLSFTSCKDKVIDKPDSIQPKTITIEDFLTGNYFEQTVQIEDVYFDHLPGTKFNGGTSNSTGSRTLRDCNGNSLIVFTSADRDFAYQDVPAGPNSMGTIIGVASEYDGTLQFLLRTYDDVADMVHPKCAERIPVITVAEFNSGAYLDSLVRIEDVEFDQNDATFGNGLFNGTSSNANGSKVFKDCSGNTGIVFTFSSSDLSDEALPLGNGPLIGTVGEFNGTMQLTPRSLADVAGMINENCTGGGSGTSCSGGYFCDDFEGGSLTGNNAWTIETPIGAGSYDWFYGDFSGDFFAKANAYSGGAQDAESWLISPTIDLSSSTSPKLTFQTSANFAGLNIEVYVSTTYTSGTINMGDWTQLTGFNLSTANNYDEVASGDIDLSAYKNANVKIAFRYQSNPTDGSRTWQLDDILIQE